MVKDFNLINFFEKYSATKRIILRLTRSFANAWLLLTHITA